MPLHTSFEMVLHYYAVNYYYFVLQIFFYSTYHMSGLFFAKINFGNLLAGGTSASTRAVWLSTLMVILILSTSSYIVIGYLG